MRQTVFVVECDPEVRAVLGELLENEGMRPVLFRRAAEAVGSLDDERPSLCVVDGIGGAERLRGRGGERSIVPVVVFTGWRTSRGSRACVKVVDKPDIAGLLASIDAVLAPGAPSFD